MAENEEKVFKVIWKLENYSYCWKKTDDFLQSSTFQMNIYYGTSWFLRLYPRGVSSYEDYVSVYLGRSASCKGPLGIKVDYEIALIRSDGTSQYVKLVKDRNIRRGYAFGVDNLASREEILGAKRSVLLPEDILTVQCRIIPKEVLLNSHAEIVAKTHLQLERFVFLEELEFRKDDLIGFISGFHLTRFKGEEEMIIKLYGPPSTAAFEFSFLLTNSSNIKAFYCKIGILDSNDSVSQCLIDKHYHMNNTTSITESVSSIGKDEILKQKSLYLRNDKLTLHYDLTISFGVENNHIEMINFDNALTYVSAKLKLSSKTDLTTEKYPCSCSDNYSSLKNDFKNLFQERTLSDFTIKVGNENLHVHKAVLCARSSVFKAMLTSNMKETAKNMVDISDLDIDTVRRMLTFIYTGTAGDLDWKKAKSLYFAADKYVLLTLKHACSDVLKQNLSVANIGEILKLASMHADDDLKKTTMEFVCDHEREVMCSTEWKTFMIEELQLAAEIMHQIFLKRT